MSSKQGHNFDGPVFLAADHAGRELKEFIQDKLSSLGYKVTDLGAHGDDPIDDYPEIVRPAAEAVAKDHHARAIIFGKSGEGEAMVANRLRGVRAAVYTGGPLEIIRLAREHNNANILSIGAEFVSEDDAWQAVHLFLGLAFSGESRHERRIHEIDE